MRISTIFKKGFLKYLLFFTLLNFILYFFIWGLGQKTKINVVDYNVGYHYFPDPRALGQKPDIFKSLLVFDAQWYMKIVAEGYPKILGNLPLQKLAVADAATYAFFPLYPMVVFLVNKMVNNIPLTIFIFSNFLILFNFLLLYLFIKTIDSDRVAIKTALLTFLFPMAIVLRSGYAETFFLTLLIIFSYLISKKKFSSAAVIYGLMTITKANSFPLVLILIYEALKSQGKFSLIKKIQHTIFLLFLSGLPLAIFIYYCFQKTGNPFIFLKVRALWYSNTLNWPWLLFSHLLDNLYAMVEFPFLKFHQFASSKVEVVTVALILYLLIKSYRKIPSFLWYISFLFWLFPILTTTLLSYTRYQVVSFPIFYFLAKKLMGWRYVILLAAFVVGIFIVSRYFVGWYWVG